ncbi:hypothetical protein PVAND_000853 [Polypedilum vanderplanki]|uniref:Uncharacterized protein n=1 Tax=Polypedilum vanderplanki TaxID=319348 RepID=A0A9J6BMC0_POLVA|nr:hypothetical protein PVAND_000853 [Polypedilum vanderplanki]
MLSIIARRCTSEVKSTLVFVQKRTFLLAKKVSERKYKIKDKIQPEYTLIYKAPIDYYLAACNHITTLSAVLFVGFSIHQYIHRSEKTSELKTYEPFGGRFLITDTDYIYFAVAFIVINVILRISAYRFPLRIYKNGKNYTAVFEGQIPFRKDQYHFIQGAVKEEAIRGILPWRDSRFKINDERKVVMLYEKFKTPSELFIMMNKPLKPKIYEEDKIVRE